MEWPWVIASQQTTTNVNLQLKPCLYVKLVGKLCQRRLSRMNYRLELFRIIHRIKSSIKITQKLPKFHVAPSMVCLIYTVLVDMFYPIILYGSSIQLLWRCTLPMGQMSPFIFGHKNFSRNGNLGLQYEYLAGKKPYFCPYC